MGRNFLKGLFLIVLAAMAWPAEGALQLRTLRGILRNRQPVNIIPVTRPLPTLLRRQGTISTRTPTSWTPVTSRSGVASRNPSLVRRRVNRVGATSLARRTMVFTERNPLSLSRAYVRRAQYRVYQSILARYELSGREAPDSAFRKPPYDLSRESVQVSVPTNYTSDREWGLFIWISPGPRPSLPSGWHGYLARRGYIVCELVNASNNRFTYHRVGLALDARHNLMKLYNIDARRVCISGHSGGSKCAVMAGVCFPDQFSHTITFMGCITYVDLPGGTGKYYSARFDKPEEDFLSQARDESRFVLVAGEHDTRGFNAPGSNTEQTVKAYHHQFKKENYNHAHLVVVPGQGHGLPGGNWLEHALQLLNQEEE